MTADTTAILVLVGYAALGLGLVGYQAWRCPSGPMIWFLYAAERLVCGMLWRVRGVDVHGNKARCPFPPDSGALIVANHRSPSDPIALWFDHHWREGSSSIRPISFVMAREFYEKRGMQWFYRVMRAIPLRRGEQDIAAVRAALTELKNGGLVGIFPEGRINFGPPGVAEANAGVAFLALSTSAPVYPVYIAGAPAARNMVKALIKSARIRLIYGQPLDLSHYRGQRKTPELLREVTDRIMSHVAELGGVRYANHVDLSESGKGPQTSRGVGAGEPELVPIKRTSG